MALPGATKRRSDRLPNMLIVDPRRLRAPALLLLLSLITVLVGCTRDHPQSTFDTLGPVARSQANLFLVIFWAGLVVFIVVMAAMVYAVVKYRRRAGQGDPEQTHGNTPLEIAWTIAPAIIVVAIAIPTIITVFDNANSPVPPDEGGLVVDAIGHQWWFEFRYSHPQDEAEEIVFANELHIPVDEPINIRLISEDVIHSFWAPKLGGKVDMVPNNDNTLWLQADEPGVYFGQCAEFCGVSHANMRFRIVAQPREEFDAWLMAQAQPAVEPFEPLAVEGKSVFRASGCRGCHATNSIMRRAEDGSRLVGRVGPNLTHVGSRRILAAGVLDNADDQGVVSESLIQTNLRTWLESPDEVKPGNIMARDAAVYNDPERALTEPEVSALIAYLKSLK